MKVDIYKAFRSKIERKTWFVFLKAGEKLDFLPDHVKQAASDFVLKKSLDINPGENRIALDIDEALMDLNKRGYYIQGAKIESPV